MKLYEINNEMLSIFENYVDHDTGELNEQAIPLIEQLQIEESEKIESLALFIQQLQADASVIKEKTKAMLERAKEKENRAERLKAFLSNYLLSNGKSKFETPYVAISFRESKRCDVFDEDEVIKFAQAHIDMGLVKTTTEPVKSAIKKVIDSGIEVPGARNVIAKNIQMR